MRERLSYQGKVPWVGSSMGWASATCSAILLTSRSREMGGMEPRDGRRTGEEIPEARVSRRWVTASWCEASNGLTKAMGDESEKNV